MNPRAALEGGNCSSQGLSGTVPKRQNWDSNLGLLTLSPVPFLLPHSASQPYPAAVPSVIPVRLLPRFIPPASPRPFAVCDRLPAVSCGFLSSKLELQPVYKLLERRCHSQEACVCVLRVAEVCVPWRAMRGL